MAGNSHEIELDARRAEVAEARERLTTTLGQLTSQETRDALKAEVLGHVEGYKAELLAKADQFKDEILDNLRETGERTTRGFAHDAMARARENPLAIMLIGAGLGWRLFTRPPVTALLMGAGVALLMREREAEVAPIRRPVPARRASLGPTGDAVRERAEAALEKAQRNPAIVAAVGFAAGAALAGFAASRNSVGRGVRAASSETARAAERGARVGAGMALEAGDRPAFEHRPGRMGRHDGEAHRA